MVWIEFI